MQLVPDYNVGWWLLVWLLQRLACHVAM